MAGGLDDKTYRKRCRALRSSEGGDVCHLCGAKIDLTLPYTDRLSWTADHIKPRSHGGPLLGELKPSHRACNSRRSNNVTTVTAPPSTARSW